MTSQTTQTQPTIKQFHPNQFEMIIEWRGNRAGFRLQRLGFKADNFVEAVKSALRMAALMQQVGAYPKGANRIVAVAHFDALRQYDEEHRTGFLKTRQEMQAAVAKALSTPAAQQAKSVKVVKTGKPVRHALINTEGLPQMQTTRTRTG